jgi:hypothetical protein
VVFLPFGTCKPKTRDPPKCSPSTRMFQVQATKIWKRVVSAFVCANPKWQQVFSYAKQLDSDNSFCAIFLFTSAALKPKKPRFQSIYLTRTQCLVLLQVSQRSTTSRMESISDHLAKLSSCFADKQRIHHPSNKISSEFAKSSFMFGLPKWSYLSLKWQPWIGFSA